MSDACAFSLIKRTEPTSSISDEVESKKQGKRQERTLSLIAGPARTFQSLAHLGKSIALINDDLFGSHIIANGTRENGTAKPASEAGAPEINKVNIAGNSSATIGPFTTAGTFKLYCTIHAGMNLTVIVQ